MEAVLGLQLLLNGIVAGAVYAIAALGFGLIYSSTRIFHVAHGAVFTVAAYAFYVSASQLGWPLVVAAGVAVLMGSAIGLGCEATLYAPLRRRGAGPLAQLIASLGIFIVVQNAVVLVFGNQGEFVSAGALRSYEIAGLTVTGLHLLTVAVGAATVLFLHLGMARTRIGKAMRGVANNPERALAVGINPALVYGFVFAVGSALAGLAAVLVSYDIGVRPDLGLRIALVGAVSVILGGVGSLAGTVSGALLLGIAENVVVWKIAARWQETIAFAVLVIILLWRPEGLVSQTTRRG